MWQRIPKWLKNKYSVTTLIFLVFLMVFDQNNIVTQYTYRSELNKLNTEKAYFAKEIKKTKQELDDLTNNPRSLEKFAREKYFMKKENEEVFVFTQEK